MRLVLKFAAALMAGTFSVLAVNGYFRVKREVAVLQADRVRDHALLAAALGATVGSVWRADGRPEALAAVTAANARGGRVHVRWIEDTRDAAVDRADLEALASGESITRVAENRAHAGRFTYVPVVVGGARTGFVELSESLDVERRSARAIVIDTLITTLTMVIVCALLALALGVWMVGNPVRALCEKARRIGRGDFLGPLELRQKDEFAVLASELNATCGKLVEASREVARETSARIAALDQLRHADRLKTVGLLASGIAHELGTPLNVVSARARMIAVGDAEPDEVSDYGRVIADAADRMTKIIRQLLAFARRQPAQRAPRDLGTVAADTLALLRPLAAKSQVELALAPSTSSVTAVVDGDAIQQALTNLVVNAIHAMPKGGTVDVSTSTEERLLADEHPGSFVVLRVRDRGTGIPAENIPRIFEPFFTTKDVGHGTGLGLSVTHGLVQDHGGFIEVESAAGKGSIFTIHLPAGVPEATKELA